MLSRWKQRLIKSRLTPEILKRIDSAPMQLNSAGFDDWGLDPETVKVALAAIRWLYTDYFRVETVGIENVPEGRVLLIANHGGQVPIDGLLISMSMLLDANPARIVRGMVERWVPALPFISTLFMRCGQMVGDHRNCRELLEKDQAVMVFPEGTRGSGKTIYHRYQLQRFGTGFIRLALETKTPIIPVAVVGCEEIYPSIADLKPLARLLKIPYVPITPFFPLLGPLGAIPLPTKVTLRFGKPIRFDADPDSSDAEVEKMVDQVKDALKAEINKGLKKRRERLFTGSAK